MSEENKNKPNTFKVHTPKDTFSTDAFSAITKVDDKGGEWWEGEYKKLDPLKDMPSHAIDDVKSFIRSVLSRERENLKRIVAEVEQQYEHEQYNEERRAGFNDCINHINWAIENDGK